MKNNIYHHNTIYILKLTSNKFYIGTTLNLNRCFANHRMGTESLWTKKYKPLYLIDNHRNEPEKENYLTISYMYKYGINNVRGGKYLSIDLSEKEIKEIKLQFDQYNLKCLRCGKNHYQHQCFEKIH